jgi:hypothetical protein
MHRWAGFIIAYFGFDDMGRWDHHKQAVRKKRPLGNKSFFKIAFLPGLLQRPGKNQYPRVCFKAQ